MGLYTTTSSPSWIWIRGLRLLFLRSSHLLLKEYTILPLFLLIHSLFLIVILPTEKHLFIVLGGWWLRRLWRHNSWRSHHRCLLVVLGSYVNRFFGCLIGNLSKDLVTKMLPSSLHRHRIVLILLRLSLGVKHVSVLFLHANFLLILFKLMQSEQVKTSCRLEHRARRTSCLVLVRRWLSSIFSRPWLAHLGLWGSEHPY